MQEAGIRADMLRQIGEEGDYVVSGLALDLVDACDLERTFLPDRARGTFRNDAGSGERIAGMRLDLEPDTEAVLRFPNGGHRGPAVARDHGAGPKSLSGLDACRA